jgi:hypothetical protein
VRVGFAIIPASRGVYTLTFALTIAAALLGIGCSAPSPGAQPRLTVSAAMAKGPTTAPVTIVEFSDYQ